MGAGNFSGYVGSEDQGEELMVLKAGDENYAKDFRGLALED